MRKVILGSLLVVCTTVGVIFVLCHEKTLVTHPQGIIAYKELKLIGINYLLMLLIVIPTFIALFLVAWKYRVGSKKAVYDPEQAHPVWKEALLWIVPTLVILVMALITWKATHDLDPYQPLQSPVHPLAIQVVALVWKWLFIYPDQQIATLNYVQFPAKTPIHFSLSADGSPMNSFWVPQLSGQIYSMSGMVTPLHLMADAPGVFAGRAAEINGKGFADMTFIVEATSASDFDAWVKEVKQSPLQLTESVYDALVKPSQNLPVTLYSSVDEGLFHKIVMKYE